MNRFQKTIIWLVATLVVFGCASPLLATPAPPAQSPGGIETAIVQTAVAAHTRTAQALPETKTPTITPLPSKTATVTPTPTSTVLFFIPTEVLLTPVGTDQLFTDDGSAGDGTPGKSFVTPKPPEAWECKVLATIPGAGAVLDPGKEFKAQWLLENTGTRAWPKKSVDYRFKSGARIHDKAYYDIPATTSPGETVTVTVDMIAPKAPQIYTTRWTLMVGRTQFCTMVLTFEIKKP